MKKYLPYANFLAAGAGLVGALLQQWPLVSGPDAGGLYPAPHPGWIGYLLVMAATTALLYLMCRDGSRNCSWECNSPTGIFPVLGHILAGAGLALYALPLLQSTDKLLLAGGVVSLGAAAVLPTLALLQIRSKPSLALLYLLPCLAFTLQLLLLCKENSTETQLMRYLPQLLALAASSLASYQLSGFGADSGDRSKSLFWSLTATALCLAAVPGAHPYFLLLGLWHLTGHCSLSEPAAPTTATEETNENNE